MASQKHVKTIYYRDLLHDDFSGTTISQVPIDENYKFVRKNIFFRIGAFILTFIIALPILFCILKIKHGVKVKNKKVLRKLKGKAYFLYGNHTQSADSYIPQVAINPFRKTYILSNPDATSIKGLKTIVEMLGAIPLPDANQNFKASKNFLKALDYYVNKNKVIAIYPEAHIWPYYTGIRPFLSNSFVYPVNYNVPALAVVATYQSRRFKKTPRLILTLSAPFYPDLTLSKKDARDKLRNEVYEFMKKEAASPLNHEYYLYIAKPND
ncbi:MAG: hypothetical protein RBS24_02060 [Bacilli bacterium]|nr:hypothetical protein [Bacilli bacterium]